MTFAFFFLFFILWFLGKISRTTVENQQANKMLGNIGKLTAQVLSNLTD
jgi:hypothetical protein